MAAPRASRDAFSTAAAEAKRVVRRAGHGWNKHDENALASGLRHAKAVGVPDNLAGPLTLALAGVGAAVALGLGPFAGAAVSTAVADALAAEPEEEEVPATPSRDNSDDLWLDRQIDKAIDFLKGLLGR